MSQLQSPSFLNLKSFHESSDQLFLLILDLYLLIDLESDVTKLSIFRSKPLLIVSIELHMRLRSYLPHFLIDFADIAIELLTILLDVCHIHHCGPL